MHNKWIQVSVCIAFLLLLAIPFLLSDKSGGMVSVDENRFLATAPILFRGRFLNWQNGELIHQIDDWINDNTFGRKQAKHLFSQLDAYVFQEPVVDTFLLSGDWVFLWRADLPDRALHADRLNTSEIESFLAKIDTCKDYFEDQGIAFTMTIYPHKLDVCSQYLPSYLHPVHEQSLSEQLEEILCTNEEIHVTSCIQALKETMQSYAQGQDDSCYYQAFDPSHWNWYGAFQGYTSHLAAMQEVYPNIPVFTEKDYTIEHIEVSKEYFGKVYHEEDTLWQLLPERKAVRDDTILADMNLALSDPWHVNRSYMNDSRPDLPRALIIGDSYTWMFFLDDLAESFSELIYINIEDTLHVKEIVEQYHPDIVSYAGINLKPFIEAMP